MEKLTKKQFLLIIDGPSCGGKSATANYFIKKFGGICHIKGDIIKWFISDYNSETYRGIVSNLRTDMIYSALKNNLSVLTEGTMFKPGNLTKIAEKLNIKYFIANVSAPLPILEKRFKERVEAKKNGVRVANTVLKRLREINDMYLKTKMKTILEFDSSVDSSEYIFEKICSHIKNKLD